MSTPTILPADPTLEEIRAALAPVIAANAAFDGWKEEAVRVAAEAHGVDPALAAVAFKGADGQSGPGVLIDAWFAHVDAEMTHRLPADMLAAMPIRQRITALIEARLDILEPQKEALRRALAVLAFPIHAPLAARLAWRAADAMWRLAGDTATDYNHYTKRMTLGAVYAATLAVFLDDERMPGG